MGDNTRLYKLGCGILPVNDHAEVNILNLNYIKSCICYH